MRTDCNLFFLTLLEMNRISKPDLVDLLRISDHRRWIHPRIRYASIRSKPDLLKDLRRHFQERVRKGVIEFVPRFPAKLRNLPKIQYHLKEKTFLFDGRVVDAPRRSREKVLFHFSRGPVTLTF